MKSHTLPNNNSESNTILSANYGLMLGILTFIMWGFFPIYFKFLSNVGALEVLSHRIIWSVIFLYIFIKLSHRERFLRQIFRDKKKVFLLLITGFFIASNWGIYIYAVNSNQILESGLGYLINPLFSMLLGAIFLKERLNLAGKISVILVFIAIGIQIYALGRLPFISVLLPASFAIYGLIKKRIAVPSMEGLFVETLLLFPFALFYVFYLGDGGNFKLNLTGFLLAFSGIVTILPLLTFNIAASSAMRLSTLGVLQYLSPSLQIIIAVVFYGEILDTYKIISFAIIWLSIAIITIDGIKRRNRG